MDSPLFNFFSKTIYSIRRIENDCLYFGVSVLRTNECSVVFDCVRPFYATLLWSVSSGSRNSTSIFLNCQLYVLFSKFLLTDKQMPASRDNLMDIYDRIRTPHCHLTTISSSSNSFPERHSDHGLYSRLHVVFSMSRETSTKEAWNQRKSQKNPQKCMIPCQS